jgi:hypothetical protein
LWVGVARSFFCGGRPNSRLPCNEPPSSSNDHNAYDIQKISLPAVRCLFFFLFDNFAESIVMVNSRRPTTVGAWQTNGLAATATSKERLLLGNTRGD